MKKILGLCLSMLLCFSFMVGVSAATPNENVLSAIKNAGVPAEYYNQAESYLRGVTLTEAQANVIVSNVDEAVAILKGAGVTSIEQVDANLFNKIKGNIEAAAKVLGLNVVVDYANKTVSLVDSTGKVIFETSQTIKNTGDDYTGTIAVASLMIILLAGAALVANKKGLFVR